MVSVLDELKMRQAEAVERLQKANLEFQQAQAKLQAAQQEANIWTGAVQVESRNQEQRQTVQAPKTPATALSAPSTITPAPTEPANQSGSSDVNKTEVVRELLRHRPTGMTPAELWDEVKGQMTHAYLYSILKRLKDRDQVSVKRKKYCLRTMIARTEDKQNITLPVQ